MVIREFLSGFAGSIGFLLLCVINAYEKKEKLPACYYKKPYWCARIAFAMLAGFLPVLFNIGNPTEGFGIGICAPIIFQTIWEKTLPSPKSNMPDDH
jgi:hypothetical protein